MATTTPNYGWSVPTSTDLVKDGATAIETLGDSADATVKALNPETTLGDISYRSSTANTKTRLGIGTTGQVLTVSGGVPSWATAAGGGLKSMTLLNAGGTALTGSATVTVSGISGQQALLVILDGASCTSASQIGVRVNGISTSNYRQVGIQAEASVNNQLNALTGRWIMGDTGGAAETLMGGCIIYGTGAAGIMAMHSTGIAGGSGRIGNASTGYFDAAAAVTSISASANANFDAGTMYIYGMSA
jgi:hypothetical protein